MTNPTPTKYHIQKIKVSTAKKTIAMDYAPDSLRDSLRDKPGDFDQDHRDQVLTRIINAYHRAIQYNPPPEYLPTAGWKAEIENTRRDYLNALLNKDKEKLGSLLDNMWRNGGLHSITKYHPWDELAYGPKDNVDKYGNSEIDRSLVAEILVDAFTYASLLHIKNGYKNLEIPHIGNPFGIYLGDHNFLITSISFSQCYYAERAKMLVKGLVKRRYPTIAEIGGGAGLLPYYLLRDEPNWTYFNFDLPEMLIYPQYFLMMASPERQFWLCGERGGGYNTGGVYLYPNFALRALPRNSVDLYLNFHSFGEMSWGSLEEYFRQIERTCRVGVYHENSNQQSDISHPDASEENKELPIINYPELDGFMELFSCPSPWREGVYIEKVLVRKN